VTNLPLLLNKRLFSFTKVQVLIMSPCEKCGFRMS
jgi:hypothetical protein